MEDISTIKRTGHTRDDSDHSRSTTGLSLSTVPTSVTTSGSIRSSEFEEHFAQFRDWEVSQEPPSRDTIKEAGSLFIYDSNGNALPFKSLYSGITAIGERQLIIFVRHFYCGACQAYLKRLTESIDHETYFSMPIPTSITVIGCGSPNLINGYRKQTGTPWPIFADPSRRLFKALGMSWSMSMGPRPEYMDDISPVAWGVGQWEEWKQVKGVKDRFRGGNPLQIGGEWLFEDGQVIWCHRMKNMRGHAEISEVRKVLGIDEA
ncbi:hypothetical protein K402DRAFT_413623 [Aulographum hederae CBS 113979]|uniref:AhpC/TSA antioxidant enzyme-domain-containing protein n=1 Tax=Aulographum hederae CBS 113979 TaxID=1176131 RepID=A0A6G1GW07_9PEZI|nr:hypothetical protein K402DRAFT_413623 [Aulographum hederae CBS 113979]